MSAFHPLQTFGRHGIGRIVNRVVQFDRATMAGEENIERLLVEFDERGFPLREIGIGTAGRIIHRFPGTPTLDEYGIMDGNVIAIAGEENQPPRAILMYPCHLVPLATFEELWASD